MLYNHSDMAATITLAYSSSVLVDNLIDIRQANYCECCRIMAFQNIGVLQGPESVKGQ